MATIIATDILKININETSNIITNTLLEDIVSYLITHHIAIADGVDIFRNYAPETPDNAIILYEYAGDPSIKTVDCSLRSVQVTVRNLKSSLALNKINTLFRILDRPDESITYLTNNRWAIITSRQTPFKIDVDSKQRIIYGFNLNITTYRD